MEKKKYRNRKFKVPDTIHELNNQSKLREMSDDLIDPKNQVTAAIIITMNKDKYVSVDMTNDMTMVSIFGMIEFAKTMIISEDLL
jgi:hypothetical protein